MSKISRCRECGGNVVEPAYPGDGAYPVAPMCKCDLPEQPSRLALSHRPHTGGKGE